MPQSFPPPALPASALEGFDAVSLIGEGDAQPAPALAASPPGFLPGSSMIEEADLVAASSTRFVSMRGAVLAPETNPAVSHPVAGGPRDILFLPLPRGAFSLRGVLMHVFVSYRVDTEGHEGNGLAERLATKIRSMSVDPKHELQLPRHGWGVWPQSAKRPVPFLPEQAKVFLDKDCLQDGQSWLAGFVQGLVASMTFVPLLSWSEDDQGSLGELSRIGVNGFDRVDNVLLELILAMALREEPGAACQAVLPVLVGPAAEGGGFGPFPFYKLARLSDEPSRATNARAGGILQQLGLSEDKVQAVLRLSVKQVVDSVLRNQGVQASASKDVADVVTECGSRVLQSVLQAMRRLRSDPKQFEQGRPMGSEVLEWLQEENLRSYAPLFVHHRLDSLEHVARLEKAQLSQLFDEHEQIYPRSGQRGAMGGQLLELEMAHSQLLCRTPARGLGLVSLSPSGPRPDERTLPLSHRLERYRDTEASGMALLTSGNCLELIHTKGVVRWGWIVFWMAAIAFRATNVAGSNKAWGAVEITFVAIEVNLAIGAVLPLACRTARAFADAVVPWAASHGLVLLLHWGTLGRYGEVATLSPLFVAVNVTMRYRQKSCTVVMGMCLLLMFPLGTVANCAFDHIPEDSTYGGCVAVELENNAPLLFWIGCMAVFFVGRKYANDFSARRAARESREHHRALWREELSKVAATPEVTDGLRRLAGGIARELQEQRRHALRSLTVVRRVMAFLNQRAGRWSLRGHTIKARQAHGDIDLLFREATTVNEPFLDLISALVAGTGSTDGPAGESDAAGAGMALKRGPVKKPARALQKLVRLYGRDVAMLTDLVRCTVLAEDLRQVSALMATLEARSVVGLAGAEKRGGAGDEEDPILDTTDGDEVFRITAIKNRFDESYDDIKSGGYRDLSLNVEVGWVMAEGVVSFEKVKDWASLECQRHICEIQVRLRSQHHQITRNGLHTRYVELRNKNNA